MFADQVAIKDTWSQAKNTGNLSIKLQFNLLANIGWFSLISEQGWLLSSQHILN